MPSSATITAFNEFSPNTSAKSSEVNTNFSVFRGHILPVNTDTASASDLTHDLGTDDHRWNKAYVGSIDLETSTTTASLIIEGSLTDTTGAFNFVIEGSTVTSINANGLDVVGSLNLAFQYGSANTNTSEGAGGSVWKTVATLSATSVYNNYMEVSFGPHSLNAALASYEFQSLTIGVGVVGQFRIYRDTTTNVIFENQFQLPSTSTSRAFPSTLFAIDFNPTAACTYAVQFAALTGNRIRISNCNIIAKELPYGP